MKGLDEDGVPTSLSATDEKDLVALEPAQGEVVEIPKEPIEQPTVDFAGAVETGELSKPPMFEYEEPGSRPLDPLGGFTIFDELSRGIHWTAQAHAEIWGTFNRAIYELRMRDKKIFDLENMTRELLGQPPLDAPERPLFTPPEKPEHLIVIGERALQKWVRALFVSVVVLFSALFIAWALFLTRV